MSDPLPATVAQWHEAIAKGCGTSPEHVSAALERLGIRGQPILPRARSVNLTSVEMAGEKRGTEDDRRFSFVWSGLGPGLWALLSEGNSKGKSSILFAVRAALQGRFRGRIKADIWNWIDFLRVGFMIDATRFQVTIRKEAGVSDEKLASATLTRDANGIVVTLYDGAADSSLESAMGGLFMSELGFEAFHAFRTGTESPAEHGWPSMSSAMFITGPSKAIFGENAVDGLPIRLIQLFIGLPWVSTYTAVSSALKQVNATSDRRRATASAERARVSGRVNELEAQLSTKREALSRSPDRPALRNDLERLDSQVAAAQGAVTETRNQIEALRERQSATTGAHIDARRLLQQAKDEAAAGYVFRKLKPACCPACESGFKPGRFEAVEAATCGLCGNSDVGEEADDASDLSALDMAVKDADAARKAAFAALTKAENALSAAENRRDASLKAMREAERRLSANDISAALQMEIAVLEGRLAELELPDLEVESDPEPDANVVKTLKTAENLTKRMMEELQAEVMQDVETETHSYARRLGVQNLESFSFKAHSMVLRQGGVDTTFIGLNPGENLRMRVAASLATMKVARNRGYGRHPGLLILDSPAAAEMTNVDFSQLVKAVGDIVDDIPGVQVVVGGVKRPELDGVVDFAHRKEATGNDTLF